MADDLQSKAADLVKKALTVGVGAIFLTEESLRGLVSEFKLPKELLTGILDSANKAKNDFLQNLSRDVLGRIQDRLDARALIEELLHKNELDVNIKVRLKPRGPSSSGKKGKGVTATRDEASYDGDGSHQPEDI